jgi:hypothetical protein
MRNAVLVAGVVVAAAGFVGCDGSEGSSAGLDEARQEYVDSVNGLVTVNGMTAINGLISVNGMTAINGLTTVNGMTAINGLTTVNGMTAINGMTATSTTLSVDCLNRTSDVDCTGEPDGLLSRSTGMMASDEGIITAKYLVRCALPAGDSLRIKDYTGALVTLTGELGLTPEWKTGTCDGRCQELISACLMALTNGNGVHLPLELSSTKSALGGGHSKSFRYQEGAFFGNLFVSPPQAYYCTGSDYASTGSSYTGSDQWVSPLSIRACSGYSAKNLACPYVHLSVCNAGTSTPGTCAFDKKGTALSCTGSGSTVWGYPITSYRDERPALCSGSSGCAAQY